MEWSEGDLVWFDPGLGHPLPDEIQEVHRAAQVIIVQALINGKAQTFTLAPGEGSLRPRQDLGSSGVDDMTQLEYLHEASLLWNLRLRYDRGMIYTFAGSILIAVNPYKMFPDSYGLEIAKQYAGPAPPPPNRPPTGVPPMPPPPIAPVSQHPQEMPAFVQRRERDTFGAHQNWNGSEMSKDGYDSWGRAESAKLDMVYESNYKKEVTVERRERERFRSRSRDREHFSVSVWDRSEVEGPPSSGSDRERYKEREKRDRIYELRHVEREKENNKVYKPVTSKQESFEKEKIFDEKKLYERDQSHEKDKNYHQKSYTQAQERATFKTHMANRLERERKNSASTFITQSTDKHDEVDKDEWTPVMPAPATVPPSLILLVQSGLCDMGMPWRKV